VSGDEGRLDDVVTFGHWKYEWGRFDFIVYEVAYIDRFARVNKVLYVLAPAASETPKPLHHPDTDSLLLAAGAWTNEIHNQVWVFDNAQWTKSRQLWTSVQDASWDDVIVRPEVRSRLEQDVDGFFSNRGLYQRSKVPWKRGIIFHGVPGVGKTLFIKVLIKSLAQRSPPIPTLYVKSLDACAGPKWSVKTIFDKARRLAPCLLVLEDLDSLVADSVRSYFLNEVDGLASNDGILMIGSTNHLDRLDPAVTRRPSRFDRKYLFDLPGRHERLAYCHYWRKKQSDLAISEELCLAVARLTEGFSFAYLKELFVCSSLSLIQGHDLEAGSDGSERRSKDVGDRQKDLPEIEVPSSVQDDPLFWTMKSQIRALIEDMDSGSHSEPQQPNASRPPPIQYRMQSLLDDPDE
jgi:DNA polymerase III delta prime subunit